MKEGEILCIALSLCVCAVWECNLYMSNSYLLGDGDREDFLFVVLEGLGDFEGLRLFLFRRSLRKYYVKD